MYISSLLVTIVLSLRTFRCEVLTPDGNFLATEKERPILDKYNIEYLDISLPSKQEFKTFLEAKCLVNLYKTAFLDNYLKWERVEFLKSVRNTLGIPDEASLEFQAKYPELYNYLFAHHDFRSSCSRKNASEMQIHHDIADRAAFDNFIFDLMSLSSEDITIAWGHEKNNIDSQNMSWRFELYQDVQESFDKSKLFFLHDQDGENGKLLAIFDLTLKCFVGTVPLNQPGTCKFIFALKCPSIEGGTTLCLVTDLENHDHHVLNVFRIELSGDDRSVISSRPIVEPLEITGEFICTMRHECPELIVMANPGLRVLRLDCTAEKVQIPHMVQVPNAELSHFYDGFVNRELVVLMSATPDGHFDHSRVHILELDHPQTITTRPCLPDPVRGFPVSRRQCGLDSIPGAILLAGGELINNGQVEKLVDYWILDTNTFQWTQLDVEMTCALIEPRVLTANSGNIYIWGDSDEHIAGLPQMSNHLRILRITGLLKENDFGNVSISSEIKTNEMPPPSFRVYTPHPSDSGKSKCLIQ
ncbi:unnamed protein product [Caenorhabditis bovis]|uniref:LisH domain-containing protein n=1 Tax=Caenorhabditis bovis TaxID=2654633 RepID=A0A8S1EVU6_9PELO|nr:unnamed protein product [Caenorhabditis bovis]